MINDVDGIKRSDQIAAVGNSLVSEVGGILSMLHSIDQGINPARAVKGKLSEFYTQCLIGMEYFCSAVITQDVKQPVGAKGKLNFKKEVREVFGQKALKIHFDVFTADFETGPSVKTLKDVQVFRTFEWMLSEDEKSVTDGWVSAVLKSHMGGGLAGLSEIMDKDGDVAKTLACVPVSASTVSLKGDLGCAGGLPSGSSPSSSSKEDNKKLKDIAAKASMLRFFAGRPPTAA